jgi:hypothetical protein
VAHGGLSQWLLARFLKPPRASAPARHRSSLEISGRLDDTGGGCAIAPKILPLIEPDTLMGLRTFW